MDEDRRWHREFSHLGGYGKGAVSDTASYLFPRGIVRGRELSRLDPMDPEHISEQIARSWYAYTNGDAAALHPYKGETNAEYTGPKTPYQWLQTDEKYSWLKAPRYGGEVMEVGPLARVLVAYAAGSAEITTPVDRALHTLGLGQAPSSPRWSPQHSTRSLTRSTPTCWSGARLPGSRIGSWSARL